ncbi:hypothetical protein ISR92_00180 [Patescibacteria group bacterium]|nr:hypothetical protein [Patescibacteria group bacterium]
MLKHDVKSKDLLQMHAYLHKLRTQANPLAILQSNILMALIDNRKDKQGFCGVKAEEFIHDNTEQMVLRNQTIQAWNNLTSTLQNLAPNAILTGLPEMHNA